MTMTFNEWLESTVTLQNETYGIPVPFAPSDGSYTDEEIQYFKDHLLAASDELHEALHEVTWKPWTVGTRTVKRELFVGELVDVMHFVANLLVAVGCTGDELTRRYRAKQHLNKDRQANGYTGTEKCVTCGRALDDPGVTCIPTWCDVYATAPLDNE